MADDIYFDDDISSINDTDIQKKNPGRKRSLVWTYFEEVGEKKYGHIGCRCKICGWSRKVGKAHEMVDHLAFTCSKASGEIKNIFLQEIRTRTTLKDSSTTTTTTSSSITSSSTKRIKLQDQKINTIFETTKIDAGKEQRCNRALTRLFVCCGIPFHVISNPFFIDFIKSLCPSYDLPNRVTFAGSWVNQELAHVTCDILDIIQHSNNITLGKFVYLFFLLLVNYYLI